MKKHTANPTKLAPGKTRRIVVVHEDLARQEQAIRFCDDLAELHRARAGLDVSCWSFALLRSTAGACDAAEAAAAADLVVFALAAAGDLPEEIKLWIENWVRKRSEREGALVGLIQAETGLGQIACLKEIYLRNVAHRAGMDYLSHAPPTAAKAIPDSLDSFSRRAGQITSVLDEILHTHPPRVSL